MYVPHICLANDIKKQFGISWIWLFGTSKKETLIGGNLNGHLEREQRGIIRLMEVLATGKETMEMSQSYTLQLHMNKVIVNSYFK